MDVHDLDGSDRAKDPPDQEIRYEAVSGYRPVFFVCLVLAGAYLTYIFQAGSHG